MQQTPRRHRLELSSSVQSGMHLEMSCPVYVNLSLRKQSLELENIQLREDLDEAKNRILTLYGQLKKIKPREFSDLDYVSSDDSTVTAGSRARRRSSGDEFGLFKGTVKQDKKRSLINLIRNRCLD
jgi:cell division protein FtsB